MIAAAPRFRTLDGLRGIAVMGIVLMNAADFALPHDAYLQPALGGTAPADTATWTAEFILADGKFRNLFALLFGASMLLVADRTEAEGRSGAATHYRRMAWLLLFGIAHLYLLWWGDILHHYAIVGSLAFLLRDRPVHALVTAGIIVLAIDMLFLSGTAAGLWSLRAAAIAPGASAEVVAQWHATGLAGPPTAGAVAREIALFRGDYAGILSHRLGAQRLLPLLELESAGPETFALMLFGMAALRSGFLTGGWPRATYRRIVAGSYAIGLPVMVALAIWCVRAGFDALTCFTAVLVLSLPVRALLMFGHASLVILWLTRKGSGRGVRVIAAGRMALSNYLLTSLLMTTLFYGYGAGWFATLGQARLLVPTLACWAAMLGWSAPWLARFRFGPAEWLWRSLARWHLQPMRTSQSAIARRSQ